VLPPNSTKPQLLEVLGHARLDVDEEVAKPDVPIDQVTATLGFVRAKGMVRQYGGM
jgi:hypothetical protein